LDSGNVGQYLYLRHDDGTRVEVRAPSITIPDVEWARWFERISRRYRFGSKLYMSHVTWHEAENREITTVTSGSISPAVRQRFEEAVAQFNQEMSEAIRSVNVARDVTDKERWKGVPASDIPRLERLLAEQVAHGGQDGGAARRMLVMRERLRAEEHARSAAQWKRHEAYEHHQVRVGQLVDNGPGITSLKLDRPLIAYKRSGR
jgi:hypothetical protein